MKNLNLKKVLGVIGGVVILWFLFIQNGGDTITILNRSGKEICEVYFSYDSANWGRNRLISEIKYPHSRDIRLPIYFEWFADNKEAGYNGRVVSCDGVELDVVEGIGGDVNFYIWEVR